MNAPNREAFAELVRQMREAQSRYFRDCSSQALNHARELERRVDRACAHILDAQRELF